MKCSEYVKSKGVKSLAFLSDSSGVQVRTLQNWYVNNRLLFDTVIVGVLNK
jgi:hypothetical protein